MEEKSSKFGNINNIKSKYILEGLFEFVSEIIKLELIVYNNKLKNILNIDIENYKNQCQIELIIEKNGNVKEYYKNTNILVYEGEYKNGKRNGKGKEYYFDKSIKFQGEYLKGEPLNGTGLDEIGNIILKLEKGIGKEYYDNGIIQFEGEYYKGRRWNGKGYNYKGKEEFKIKYGKGIGKEYNYYGDLVFEGEYLNGFKNGKGILYMQDECSKFEGEFINGQELSGKGYNNYNRVIIEFKDRKVKEYFYNGKIRFCGKFFKGRKWNSKGYNYEGEIVTKLNNYCMIIMGFYYSKENI